MKNPAILLFALLLAVTGSCKNKEFRTIHEQTEWSHTWIVNTSDTILPRILIIGDSHAERYYPHVAYSLNKLANVCKLSTSKSLGDPVLIDQVKIVLKQHKFDIITFNNGLHGRDYSEKEYGDHLPELIETVNSNSKAEVILVNTTPAREANKLNNFQEFNQKIVERNRILSEYASKHGLTLIDFYNLGSESIEYYTDDGIHFNKEGVKKQAEILTDIIKQQI